jgi:hypothetical protein
MVRLLPFVVWVDGDLGAPRISSALDALWASVSAHWDVQEDGDITGVLPYVRLGRQCFLLHAEEHWSPGDVAGFLAREMQLTDDSCMAFRMETSAYIPLVGVGNSELAHRVRAWAGSWHSSISVHSSVRLNFE